MAIDADELFSRVHFVTVDELAEITRLSKMTIYRMIKSGEIECRTFCRSFRIPVAAARKLVEGDPPDGA